MSAAKILISVLLMSAPAFAQSGPIRPEARPVWMEPTPVNFVTTPAEVRPKAREVGLPNTRWYHIRGSDVWTKSTLVALKNHGARLEQTVPNDIAKWCPAYAQAGPAQRRHFWVGLMSTLAKHESTYRPAVSGDSGRSHGLLQIRTPTAELFGCQSTSKAQLHQPVGNLSCAVRIMSKTVIRDNAVSHKSNGKRGGMGADWGPFVQSAKREDMRAWVKRQDYCQRVMTAPGALRPKSRPDTLMVSQAVKSDAAQL